ncbi:DUF6415 family natural product biosynthesis protein [Streptomyces sp. NPDC052114]|uniref:DUF6415 family natural product biosynthesis protein n=1 Tax=unclassified Streptomyces TaxID=2593676 RepID=UPI0034315653
MPATKPVPPERGAWNTPRLPAADALSDAQVRGRDCVFCGITLRAGAAVDLGAQHVKRLDARVNWFPRACRPCADGAYVTALLDAAFSACRALPPPDELMDLHVRLQYEIHRRLPAARAAAAHAGERTLTWHSHRRVIDAVTDALADGPGDRPSPLALALRAAELGRRLRDLTAYPPCEDPSSRSCAGSALDLLKSSDLKVLDAANWVVSRYADSPTETRQAPVDAYTLPLVTYRALLAADVSTVLELTGLPDEAPAPTATVTVEGYSETITRNRHLLNFHTARAQTDTVWVLDDPTYSVLGSTTRLAY